MRERNHLAGQMDGLRALQQEVSDTLELIAMAETDGDTAMVDEGMTALRASAEEAKRREIDSLLAGEADTNDAYVEINAGTGGTDSASADPSSTSGTAPHAAGVDSGLGGLY